MDKVAPTTARETSEHWTERSSRFNGGASHLRHEAMWIDAFRAALGDAPLRVLDLGTGTGACALLLAGLGHEVTAVDGSQGMLATARNMAQERGLAIDFIHATMDEADLPAASFDVVTLRNVLWTLETPVAALRLARRALKPNGRVLISDGKWRVDGVPYETPAFYGKLPFANGMTEQEGRAMLAEAGFGGVRSYADRFAVNPYETMGDPAFFLLTAQPQD